MTHAAEQQSAVFPTYYRTPGGGWVSWPVWVRQTTQPEVKATVRWTT